ncbi:unnamed protein product [Rotaria socialis]
MINSTIGKKLHPTKKKTKNSQLDHIEGTGENDQIEKKRHVFVCLRLSCTFLLLADENVQENLDHLTNNFNELQMDPVHPSLPAPPNDTPSLPAPPNDTPSLPATSNEKTIITSK